MPSVTDVTRQDIESYLEYCYCQGNKNQTRLTKLIAIRRFFGYLVYEGAIKNDITLYIHRPKISRRGIQIFTKEEILKLFFVMDPTKEKGLRDINILILGIFCGLRISKIIKLNLPGEACLDMVFVVQTYEVIIKALKKKEYDNFNEIAAFDISQSIEVLRMCLDDIMRDGTIVKSERYN